jgi:cyclopropane fatty-acyl-phospholipid synthase-like methyltransferase
MYDWLQQTMLGVLSIETRAAGCLVDLGAGSGIFLEKALQRNPDLHGVWVDSSPAFMAVAQRRLAAFADRMCYVLCPLEGPWEEQITEPVRAITSMSAIHHLESAEKRALYQRCFTALAPGGWFLNCDEMCTISPEAYLNSLHAWVNYVDAARDRLSPEQIAEYERWLSHFSRWKVRNIEHVDEPKHKGDDLHESFLTQLSWLQEIGFTGVDLFAKYQLWSIIGGRK